jgi:hypothetical protein
MLDSDNGPYLPDLDSAEYCKVELAHLMNSVVKDPERVVNSIDKEGCVTWKNFSQSEINKITRVRLKKFQEN